MEVSRSLLNLYLARVEVLAFSELEQAGFPPGRDPFRDGATREIVIGRRRLTDFSAGGPSDGSDPAACMEKGDRAGGTGRSASFELLQRLAASLDVPVGAFLDQTPGSVGPMPRVLTEASNLLAAFSRISCPVARRRCIDLVEAAGRPEDAS